jgi:hypothetical protein
MTERTCALCGTAAPPPFKAPQPEIAPDLDMRPGEPTRSTLRDWLQVCRHCGAVGPDLATLPPSARETVGSAAYRALSTQALEETLPFRRWALICERMGETAQQAEALLQAAWAADDAAAMSEAASLRSLVAALWAQAPGMEQGAMEQGPMKQGAMEQAQRGAGQTDPGFMELGVRRLDVLRRAGQFDAAMAWADHLAAQGPDELAARIIAFQRSKIERRDIGRHLISAALPPPSHTPHVAHGKRATTGFWSRLLRK